VSRIERKQPGLRAMALRLFMPVDMGQPPEIPLLGAEAEALQ